MIDDVVGRVRDAAAAVAGLEHCAAKIAEIAQAIVAAYRRGGKVILLGNGGSAADAQHIAAEFVGRFYLERPALPALALHANSSIVTAIGNDYGFDEIFSRQIEAQARAGDVVVGISTSGNSPNVVKALECANQLECATVAFVGAKACRLDEVATHVLRVPSDDTPHIQEGHIAAGHIICYLVERELFG
jgi:D-sedoheptulose 7-phosphate isomerase